MRKLVAAIVVGVGLNGPLLAQDNSVVLSLGPTAPTGAYGEYAKAGWLAAAGIRGGGRKGSLGWRGTGLRPQ